MPNQNCNYCNKEFSDYSEYRVTLKLKQHIQDTHEKPIPTQRLISIEEIPIV